MAILPANEALERLRTGNQRFTQNRSTAHINEIRRGELLDGQSPFAIILGCSDSRVPVELIFDQGIGDLFVIRVAGNIATPVQIGSIEYAADILETQLIVVLGHTKCGAVSAAVEENFSTKDKLPPNLRTILEYIQSSIETVEISPEQGDRDTFIHQVIRANVRSTVNRLKEDSLILNKMVREDKLSIIGAEYSLETGLVDFFYR